MLMLSSSGESCNSSAARGLAEEGSSKCDACYGEGERFAMEGYDGEDDGPEDYTVVPCLKCGGTGGAECESWTKAMSRRRGVAEPAVHCHPARAGCSFVAVCTGGDGGSVGGAGGHRAVNFAAPRALEPDSALARQLRALLLEHGVLVFPGQAHLLPDDEVRIAQLFDHDATEEHPSASSKLFGDKGEPWLRDVPAVRLVGTAHVCDYFGTTGEVCNYSEWHPDQRAWHQDGTADTGPVPPRVGLLRSVRQPAKGGDTLFANTRCIAEHILAREHAGEFDDWEVKPSEARAFFRRAEKSILSRDGVAIVEASGAMTKSHGPFPLIIRDERDRPMCMYNWNLECITMPDGQRLSQEQSWQFARELFGPDLNNSNDPAVSYAHKWTQGDLVIWDQWATLHSATAKCLYAGAERLLHRVRLRGSRPPIPYVSSNTATTSSL